MPNSAAVYSSEYLTSDQMAAAVAAIPNVLDELFGQCRFTAYYGYGTNLHSALLWIPMTVETSVLPWFLQDSIDQRIVILGRSDLMIESPEKELVITICHELDIHVDGENDAIMQQFLSAEPLRGIKFYTQDEWKSLYPG